MEVNTHKKFSYDVLLTFLLLTRFFSEIITNFAWEHANYIWSAFVLVGIAVLLWPFLTLDGYKYKNIFVKYSPIFLYLLYLFFRLQFFELYSFKCFFSEFIGWFLFIFTAELSSRSFNAMRTVQVWIIRLVKVIVIVGIAQLAIFSLSNNPIYIFDFRPVSSIFAHPNIFLVLTLPFVFYFFKERSYHWAFFVLLACIGTGTRGPFLALLCMAPLVFKSIFNKKINWIDIFATLIIIAVTYYLIIKLHSHSAVVSAYQESRFSLGTLRWRIDYWKNFLGAKDVLVSLFGRGIGSADRFGSGSTNKILILPHNDYLRIYYDAGIVGALFFLNLIFFILRLIKKNLTTANDFILLTYLLIVCFYITDNFIYFTHSLLIYMFIASFLGNRKIPEVATQNFKEHYENNSFKQT